MNTKSNASFGLPPVALNTASPSQTTNPTTSDRPTLITSQFPGQALYLTHPQRLSLLSIKIDATTSITTTRAAVLAQQQLSPSLPPPSPPPPPPSAVYRHASTSKLHSHQPPPSSFHTNASHKSSRSRPLSHDFTQKARDALNDFGRLANRRQSAIERANGAETLARVADGLGSKRASSHDDRARPTSSHPLILQQDSNHQPPSFAPPKLPLDPTSQQHLTSQDAQVVRSHATRSFTLLPQSDLRFLSHSIPLSIHASITTSSDPSTIIPSPLEFTTASHNGSSPYSTSALDPSQLLLKVEPPAELARQSWSRSTSFLTPQNASQYHTSEHHSVKFRYRLRLCAKTASPTSYLFPHTERNDAPPPSTPLALALGQVLFLSAASPEKLIEAIESPSSSIASSELAALEGISRVQLTPSSYPLSSTVTRGASEFDFEWTWKSLARSSSSNASRCCCAFVEISPDGKSATLLAAISLFIQLPPSVPLLSNMLSSTQADTIPHQRLSSSDSLAIIAALNLDQEPSLRTDTAPALSSFHQDSHPTSFIAPSSTQHGSTRLLIDRTELALEDLVNDSPIFRAALVNLERRTASIKKASKAVLRASQEARLRIFRLIEAEQAVDTALQALVGMAPETIGRLQDQLLRQARIATMQHQREQASVIESCLERPLAQIVELCRLAQDGFKLFENESKTYYSQTQKWLANRSSNADPSNTPAIGNDAHRQDRADQKQKLRELRFEQARLDLFAMLQRLHGGRAEAHLARSILQLTQWLVDFPNKPHWPSHTQTSSLSALDASLLDALDHQALQLQEVESRSRQVADRARMLEHALGKIGDADIDILGAHRFEIDQTSPAPSNFNGAVSSKTRKFKSFLGVFAAGIQSSPLTLSKNASPNTESAVKQVELVAPVDGAQLPYQHPRRRHSMKEKFNHVRQPDVGNTSPFKSHAPSSWVYNNLPAAPRRGSELHESSRLRDDAASDQLSLHASQDASEGASSMAGAHELSRTSTAEQGLGIFEPASASTVQEYGLSPAPGQCSGPIAPSLTTGSDRKKEGVLWVSTKSVTGPVGADAPRGINRSNHWRECWVVLSGSGQISEFADWKNAKALEPTNPLIDLRFATVREARGVDRRFAFEIVTRDSRRLFQAPDEEAMRDWMRAISKAIESLLNGTSSVRKLDRAVRASPFRSSDSVQQRPADFDEDEEVPGVGEGNDFAVRKLLDRTTRSSTQSMNDLAASAKAQDSDRKDRAKLGAHLAGLSESHAESSVQSSRRRSQHQRGISNKTPISGYLGAGKLGLTASDVAALHRRDGTQLSDDASISSKSTSGEQDAEFDRQIEAVVHKSYGSRDDTGTSHSGFSFNSAVSGVDEMGKFKANASARATSSSSPSKATSAANASVTSTATSTKMSRSAEIAAISRRPENRHCADCQESDPRWASWMLANQPCCIFICIRCSGVHRSLGVHISKVKSVDLDDWTEEQLQAARDWGNVRANALWEHSKPAGLLPLPSDRKEFWRRKYTDQEWKDPNPKILRDARPCYNSITDAPDNNHDATPTRRSALITEASPDVVTPQSKSQSHAQELGLRIMPSDQTASSNGSAKFPDVPGSPRPNGPRPLPQQRSVTMQASAISSLSSPTAGKLAGVKPNLTSPDSPNKQDRADWTARQTSFASDDEALTGLVASMMTEYASPRQDIPKESYPSCAPSIPTSTSAPPMSSLTSTNPHVSKAMLAARADRRLFPCLASTEAVETLPSNNAKVQVSSPPSTFFVSDMGAHTSSRMLFDGPGRGEAAWDATSEIGTDHHEGRSTESLPAITNPPARFDAFASHA